MVAACVGVRAWNIAERTPLQFNNDDPLAEDGADLLGRENTIRALVKLCTQDDPVSIALTGGYGDGKTSVLNLLIPHLKNAVPKSTRPIIVRFNPWLPSDSVTLVYSLLNSIVEQVTADYFVPGLSATARSYARTLVGSIPYVKELKIVFDEPSQQEKLSALAKRVSSVGRRILVVLDDIDRMQPEELETILKILKGSSELKNVSFLSSFDKSEVANILRSKRPHQDTRLFMEKFFSSEVALPKVDREVLKKLFVAELNGVLLGILPGAQGVPKTLDEIWEWGGGAYFSNLRRIKQFRNYVANSLPAVSNEVDLSDFLRLEIVREMEPVAYETVYLRPEVFAARDLALEANRYFLGLDDKKDKEYRQKTIRDLEASLKLETRTTVMGLLSDLFPQIRQFLTDVEYRQPSARQGDSEKLMRISHHLHFRQYFVSRVPSELYPRAEELRLESSLQGLDRAAAAEKVSGEFDSLNAEVEKRWHFVHTLSANINSMAKEEAIGVCLGLSRGSREWSIDAFELEETVRDIGTTCKRLTADEIQVFLREVIDSSTSVLFTLVAISRMENKDAPYKLDATVMAPIKGYLASAVREILTKPSAPSVFDMYKGIDPNRVLLGWRALGPQAAQDQEQYLLNELDKPAVLDKFLATLFRVDFIDDYEALRPLIDYRKLSALIQKHMINLTNIRQANAFFERFNSETKSSP